MTTTMQHQLRTTSALHPQNQNPSHGNWSDQPPTNETEYVGAQWPEGSVREFCNWDRRWERTIYRGARGATQPPPRLPLVEFMERLNMDSSRPTGRILNQSPSTSQPIPPKRLPFGVPPPPPLQLVQVWQEQKREQAEHLHYAAFLRWYDKVQGYQQIFLQGLLYASSTHSTAEEEQESPNDYDLCPGMRQVHYTEWMRDVECWWARNWGSDPRPPQATALVPARPTVKPAPRPKQ
jgi:hypothetical protein